MRRLVDRGPRRHRVGGRRRLALGAPRRQHVVAVVDVIRVAVAAQVHRGDVEGVVVVVVVVVVGVAAVGSEDGGGAVDDVDGAAAVAAAVPAAPPPEKVVHQLRVEGHIDPRVQAGVQCEQPVEPTDISH